MGWCYFPEDSPNGCLKDKPRKNKAGRQWSGRLLRNAFEPVYPHGG